MPTILKLDISKLNHIKFYWSFHTETYKWHQMYILWGFDLQKPKGLHDLFWLLVRIGNTFERLSHFGSKRVVKIFWFDIFIYIFHLNRNRSWILVRKMTYTSLLTSCWRTLRSKVINKFQDGMNTTWDYSLIFSYAVLLKNIVRTSKKY